MTEEREAQLRESREVIASLEAKIEAQTETVTSLTKTLDETNMELEQANKKVLYFQEFSIYCLPMGFTYLQH